MCPCFCQDQKKKCSSEPDRRRPARINAGRRTHAQGFSLAESIIAMMILGLLCSSVLVVVDRCVETAAELSLRMQALEVARENMEKLLGSTSLKEMSEYGESEKNPEIKWQTVVESFYEPITSRMWIRGVCSATYMDADGEEQTIELEHWLTDLTKEQLVQMMKNEQAEQEALGEGTVDSVEEAAEYAQVDVETVEKWVEQGMPTNDDGTLEMEWLDLYKETGGNPTKEQKETVLARINASIRQKQLAKQTDRQNVTDNQQPAEQQTEDTGFDPVTGLPWDVVNNMSVADLFKLLQEKQSKK